MEKSRAILLKKIPLTETSLIVAWLTREQGLVRTAAKAARRASSPFFGKLDLFYECEIGFVFSAKSDLHTLREIFVQNYRPGLQSSYLRVFAASYFVRLIEQVSENQAPMPEKFDLLTRALDWAEQKPLSLKGILYFEQELARLLGIWSEQAAEAPIRAIADVFHGVPEQRTKLLDQLAS
jgi:DNA repair protein RecO (recombination protein O)